MSDSRRAANWLRYLLGREAKFSFLQRRVLAAVVGSFAACLPILPALAVTEVSGTIVATLTITFVSAPPKGSAVSCNLSLFGSDVLAPSDSQSVSAPVSGSSAVCKLTVHYGWRLESTTSTMTIAYSVQGPVQSSSGLYSTMTMPQNGTTTTVALAITQ